jgi:hypothetical protein
MVFSTYIDWLPTYDIVHEFIFPYLDYEDRIQFNQFLPREERLVRRIDKMDALLHDLYVTSELIRGYVRFIGTPGIEIQKKSKCLVNMLNQFREGRRGAALLHHVPKLRAALVQKFVEYLDPESDTFGKATPYFKTKIRGIVGEILPHVLEIQSVLIRRTIQALKIRG